MSVRFIHGDCRAILPKMEAASFDCAIVDPPYGETSLQWDRWPEGWPTAVARVLKPTGSMWVFGSLRMFLERRDEFGDFRLSHEIVWEKHNGTGPFNDRFRRVHELVAHFYLRAVRWSDVYKQPQFTNDATARTVRKKGWPKHWIGATGATVYRSEDGGPRLMTSVQFARSEHGRAIHPTQKPLQIIEPILRYVCPANGSVLDPMCGSGSVGVAAKRLGCSATLIEADPIYVGMGPERIMADAPLFAEVEP